MSSRSVLHSSWVSVRSRARSTTRSSTFFWPGQMPMRFTALGGSAAQGVSERGDVHLDQEQVRLSGAMFGGAGAHLHGGGEVQEAVTLVMSAAAVLAHCFGRPPILATHQRVDDGDGFRRAGSGAHAGMMPLNEGRPKSGVGR